MVTNSIDCRYACSTIRVRNKLLTDNVGVTHLWFVTVISYIYTPHERSQEIANTEPARFHVTKANLKCTHSHTVIQNKLIIRGRTEQKSR